MTANDQIEIPLSKGKIYMLLTGSIIFVLLGAWMLITQPRIDNPIFGNPVILNVAGTAAIVFFGYLAFILIKKTGDQAPGLVINHEGILDNSSGVSAGLVLWKDISGIVVTTVVNQKFLMIQLHNPQEYIDRQSGTIKRKAMQMNYKSYGSPVSISANALDINFEELQQLLTDRFNQSKNL